MSATIGPDEFVIAVWQLAQQHKVQDDQMASALVGIVVRVCVEHGIDPHAYVDLAMDQLLNS